MKKIFFFLIVAMLFSCKITDPDSPNGQSGYEQAELVITNKLNETISFLIDDHSTTGISVSLGSNEEYHKTWQESDAVFLTNDGVITITYNSMYSGTQEFQIHLSLGTTIYRDITNEEASLSIFNNTIYDISIILQDGGSNSGQSITVSSNDHYIRTWDEFHPLFTQNQGIAFLYYQNYYGEEIEKMFQIELGDQLFYQLEFDDDYTLKVINDTNSDVWYSLQNSSTLFLEADEFDVFIPSDFDNLFSANIQYSGYHVFSDSDNIIISEFTSKDYYIFPDAGAISITNQSTQQLDLIYISPSSSSSWGDNVLSESLEYSDNAIWTTEEGYWDIKIVEENNLEYYYYDCLVSFDQTRNVNFPDHFSVTKHKNKPYNKQNSKRIEYKRIS